MNEPKNYRAIMLSSTFSDLKEHRARVIEVISKLGYLPRVMEHSGAQAEADVIDTSLQMVRDAVAYVGVISLKYGQTPADPVRNPLGLSVTELEFNEAMRLGRPIVLFIMGTEHLVKPAEIESDAERQKKLNEFRERAKRMREGSAVERIYEAFDSVEQFSTAAATAVGNLVRYIERSAPVETSNAAPNPMRTISNIPISTPYHFVGRDDELLAIDAVLSKNDGRSAIAVLHGMRGVGKTTLAATYALRHRDKYRATWWIKAEIETTIRADLVGLGVQLGWIAVDAPEEKSVEAVLEALGALGHNILLVYDNAIGPKELMKFLPRNAGSRIIVTSNAPNWGAVATPVEIEVWPKETGADFLVARTGRATERDAALELSHALGGLPLAHEQAAAYCERVGVSLADYANRLETTPGVLDSNPDAAGDYHGGLTVAKTFALAIEEAGKRHPAAERLIAYAALLAPEPIPLYLFAESRKEFSEPFASQIEGEGLDEAVAALRAFALIDREAIPDERNPSITTDCIRLHRLVREIVAGWRGINSVVVTKSELIRATARVFPEDVHRNPAAWLRARRLDAIAVALVEGNIPQESEAEAAALLSGLDIYKDAALATYGDAQKLSERALAIRERLFGTDHLLTALSLSNLGELLRKQGNFAGARSLHARALAIRESKLGPEDQETAESLTNLGIVLRFQDEVEEAQRCFERALAIFEKALGADSPDTAVALNNLGQLLKSVGKLEQAQPLLARALAINENVLGADHLMTATSLSNLGDLLRSHGDLARARSHHERALAVREKTLGPDHPDRATSLNNLGLVMRQQGELQEARRCFEHALAILDKVHGPEHPETNQVARNATNLLEDLILTEEAAALRQKYGLKDK